MSTLYPKKEELTLFFLGLTETMGAAVEAGGEVQAELMGIALIALITSKEKYMVEDVWVFCEEYYL